MRKLHIVLDSIVEEGVKPTGAMKALMNKRIPRRELKHIVYYRGDLLEAFSAAHLVHMGAQIGIIRKPIGVLAFKEKGGYKVPDWKDKEGVFLYPWREGKKIANEWLFAQSLGYLIGHLHAPFPGMGNMKLNPGERRVILVQEVLPDSFTLVETKKGITISVNYPHTLGFFATDLPFKRLRPVLEENASRVVLALGLKGEIQDAFWSGYNRRTKQLKERYAL